jgi:RimJ/RimL family protein N-acetyltransferase
MRYWHPGPDADVAVTAARIACLDAHWRRYGFGDWAVVERESGELVGFAGLHHVPGIADVNVGYALARPRWRLGYGSELLAALVEYGFSMLDLSEIVAVIDPRNSASIALAEHAGLRLRREFLWEGRSRLFYVLTREQPGHPEVAPGSRACASSEHGGRLTGANRSRSR